MPYYSPPAAVAPLTLTSGTITASSPALTATQTWNNVAVTFTGMSVNITDTTSAAGSLITDWQLGGASLFAFSKIASLYIDGVDGSVPEFAITGYGATSSGGGGVIHSRAARGVKGTPTALLSGDFVGGYGGKPYTGTTYPTSSPGALHFITTANISDSNYGTMVRLLATPAGATVRIPVADFNGSSSIFPSAAALFGASTAVATTTAGLEIDSTGVSTNMLALVDTQATDADVGGTIALYGNYTSGKARLAKLIGGKLNNTGADTTGYFGILVNTNASAGGVTEVGRFLSTGLKVVPGTAIPAGGTAGVGYSFSSTANFGVYFGSGAPSLSAAKGSLYLRSDGSGATDRAYINTNGSTTWTPLTTVG